MVSRLAKSGIFLPEFHVPDFSLFLQHREMRVQTSGIFVSISDFFSSLLLGSRKSISYQDIHGKLQVRVEWYDACSIRVYLLHSVQNLKSERP